MGLFRSWKISWPFVETRKAENYAKFRSLIVFNTYEVVFGSVSVEPSKPGCRVEVFWPSHTSWSRSISGNVPRPLSLRHIPRPKKFGSHLEQMEIPNKVQWNVLQSPEWKDQSVRLVWFGPNPRNYVSTQSIFFSTSPVGYGPVPIENLRPKFVCPPMDHLGRNWRGDGHSHIFVLRPRVGRNICPWNANVYFDSTRVCWQSCGDLWKASAQSVETHVHLEPRPNSRRDIAWVETRMSHWRSGNWWWYHLLALTELRMRKTIRSYIFKGWFKPYMNPTQFYGTMSLLEPLWE